MKANWFFILLIFSAFARPSAQSKLPRLPKMRTHNCIIFNDVTENSLQEKQSFFWNHFKSFAITNDLLTALIEEPASIICTKSIWANMQYFAQLWYDFSHLSPDQIFQRYRSYSNESDTQFRTNIEKYTLAIKAIDQIYESINKLINDNKTRNKWDIEHQINSLYSKIGVQRTAAFCSASKILNCSQLQSIAEETMVKDIFFNYLYYKNINWNNWKCFDLNEDFLLFTQASTLPKTTPASYQPFFSTKINDGQVMTGLKGINASPFNPTQPVISMPQAALNRIKNQPYRLGNQLIDAMSKTFLLKSDIKNQQMLKYEPWLLPTWNILIAGHGSIDQTTSGLFIVGQNSEFNNLLQFMAKKINTKLFSYLSCYPAGSKLKQTFGFTSAASSQYLNSLPYIVMALGITLAPTCSFYPTIKLPPFDNVSNLQQFIDIPHNKSYGRFFPHHFYTSFYRFFQALKESPQNMQKANHAIGNILTENGSIRSDVIQNFALIKAPHTEWLSPAFYHKEITTLNQIEAMTASNVYKVPRQTKALLLFAGYVPRVVQFSKSAPIFIPMNLFSQHYYFEEIQAPSSSLTNIIQSCFSVQNSQEAFVYYIKKLTTSKPNTTYSVILKNEKSSTGRMIPIIIYIQNVNGVKTVKQYRLEVAGKITFQEIKPLSTIQYIEQQIAEGKKRSQMLVTDVSKVQDLFKFGLPPISPILSESRESFAKQDKALLATEKLIDLNQVLTLIQ